MSEQDGPRPLGSKPPVDLQGLTIPGELEPQEEVLYEVQDQPSFHVTRALFIANLRRPLSAIHFQAYLRELAREAGAHQIERAWLNRSRTHAIVLVSSEDGATYIRDKLVGSLYPPEDEDDKLQQEHEQRELERFDEQTLQYQQQLDRAETDEDKDAIIAPQSPRPYEPAVRHPLYVDFIPVKAINQWVYEEDRGPRDGKWKLEYDNRGDELIATHTLLNGDFVPPYRPRQGGRGRGGRGNFRDSYRGRDRGGPRPYPDYPSHQLPSHAQHQRNGPRPYGVPNRRDRDYYVPGHTTDRYEPRTTDSYTPKPRSRSRSRSPSR